MHVKKMIKIKTIRCDSMKTKEICIIMVAFIALCIATQSASAAPVISVEPSYLNVLEGDIFTVNITVDPAGVEVMGAQYELHFNNTLLNGTQQNQCSFLSQDGAGTNVFANNINNTIGIVKYGETRIGVDYGVTNPGILATVTFRALKAGTSSFNLSTVKLSDPFAQLIPGVLVINSTVEINETIFIISGCVNYDNGDPVLDPCVTVTNLNTSNVFIAQTSGNYYEILTNFTHINSNDTLHFNASDNLGNVSEFERTVIQDDMDAGGFIHNISIYVPDTAHPLITNITVISKTKNSATITWETDELSDSLIKYGTEPGNYIQTVYNATEVMHHCIDLPGLTSNTTYYYVVNSTDPSSNSAQSVEYNFTTFADIVIEIGDAEAILGENVTTSIMISDIANVGTADILLAFNQSTVHVTAVNESNFDFMDWFIDNSAGMTRIGAFQTSHGGLSGDVKLANITLMAVGTPGTSSALSITINELKEATSEEISIPASTHNATFNIKEATPPLVINPEAIPLYIPEDTDFDTRWGEASQLNVTIIDECGVASVTINLSSIGGLPDQIMTRIPETDIWTVATNASAGTVLLNNSTYLPHNLTVCAVDIFGNMNTSVDIPLIIIKNGDVSENGEVTLYDAMNIASYLLSKPGFETMNENIGEVSGNGATTLYDAMYLAKHVLGESGFGTLH
jgi:hypothetical protein